MNRTNGIFQSFVPFIVKYILWFGFAHLFSFHCSCVHESFFFIRLNPGQFLCRGYIFSLGWVGVTKMQVNLLPENWIYLCTFQNVLHIHFLGQPNRFISCSSGWREREQNFTGHKHDQILLFMIQACYLGWTVSSRYIIHTCYDIFAVVCIQVC